MYISSVSVQLHVYFLFSLTYPILIVILSLGCLDPNSHDNLLIYPGTSMSNLQWTIEHDRCKYLSSAPTGFIFSHFIWSFINAFISINLLSNKPNVWKISDIEKKCYKKMFSDFYVHQWSSLLTFNNNSILHWDINLERGENSV